MASKLSKMSPILEKTNKQPAVMKSYQYFYLKQKKIVANCKVVKAMKNDAVVLLEALEQSHAWLAIFISLSKEPSSRNKQINKNTSVKQKSISYSFLEMILPHIFFGTLGFFNFKFIAVVLLVKNQSYQKAILKLRIISLKLLVFGYLESLNLLVGHVDKFLIDGYIPVFITANLLAGVVQTLDSSPDKSLV